MATLSIQISDSQKDFLAARAAQEGLDSPSDFVQQLIRAAEQRGAWAALEKEIQLGIESGESIPLGEISWQDKKARLLAKHLL